MLDIPVRSQLQGLSNQVGGKCGHVFKSGEIAYNCLTCQADGTCVICFECFKNGAIIAPKFLRFATYLDFNLFFVR